MSIWKNNSSFSCRVYDLSLHRFVSQSSGAIYGIKSSGVGPKSNKKVAGYSRDVYATIVPVNSHYFSFQSSQMDKIDGYFSPLIIYMTPSSTLKAIHYE